MAGEKLTWTKNYDLFTHSNDNRPVNLATRSDLVASMQEYGFIPAYPIHCIRHKSKLLVRDGQHRLAVAQKLGLAVPYVVCDDDAPISRINNTQKKWTPRNYAESFAQQGKTEYQELLRFVDAHGIPVFLAVDILADNTGSQNRIRFQSGEFKIKSFEKASRIARLFARIGCLSPRIKTSYFADALSAICNLPDLDDNRLVAGAERRPEVLIRYGSRDGYLTMLEDIYNFGRQNRVALKIPAENIMRSRNPAIKR